MITPTWNIFLSASMTWFPTSLTHHFVVLEFLSFIRFRNVRGPQGSLPLATSSSTTPPPPPWGNLMQCPSFKYYLYANAWQLSAPAQISLHSRLLSNSYFSAFGCLIGILNLPVPKTMLLTFLPYKPIPSCHLQTFSECLCHKPLTDLCFVHQH